MFLAILIVHIHCIASQRIVCICAHILADSLFVYDHVAILFVNFFSGIPHAVDNFNCKTTLDSVAHMHFELLSRPIFFLPFSFFVFAFALRCL